MAAAEVAALLLEAIHDCGVDILADVKADVEGKFQQRDKHWEAKYEALEGKYHSLKEKIDALAPEIQESTVSTKEETLKSSAKNHVTISTGTAQRLNV